MRTPSGEPTARSVTGFMIVLFCGVLLGITVLAVPSQADSGNTSCTEAIHLRCLSETYPDGQLAMKCDGSGCKTCVAAPNQTCEHVSGSGSLANYKDTLGLN